MKSGRTTYERTAEVTGEVRAADLDKACFVLRLDDGRRVRCRFSPGQEATVINALRGPAGRRLRVRGRGEFTLPDRKLKRFKVVGQVSPADGGESGKTDTRPLLDKILEISASVPPEEWAKIPSDASINLDHYLYGAPKVEE